MVTDFSLSKAENGRKSMKLKPVTKFILQASLGPPKGRSGTGTGTLGQCLPLNRVKLLETVMSIALFHHSNLELLNKNSWKTYRHGWDSCDFCQLWAFLILKLRPRKRYSMKKNKSTKNIPIPCAFCANIMLLKGGSRDSWIRIRDLSLSGNPANLTATTTAAISWTKGRFA